MIKKRKNPQAMGLFLTAMLTLALVAVVSVLIYFIFLFYPTKYGGAIEREAQKYGLDPSLVYAVIKTESGFKPGNVSAKGAKGLMQIMDKTGEWGYEVLKKNGLFEAEMLFDPELNIEIGCWYLNRLIGQYKSVDTALAAYNAGSGNVSKWLDNPEYYDGKKLYAIPFKETREYVRKINKNKKIYEILRGIKVK